MNSAEQVKVESSDMNDFIKIMSAGSRFLHDQDIEEPVSDQRTVEKKRFSIDGEKLKNGLGQLVLTLVKLLHELLERQAIRRIDSGTLRDDEIEKLGETLMMQVEEIERLRIEFGLEDEDLNLDLGPLGKLL